MSDQQPPQPRGPTPGRNPWVTALLILIGIVLLLARRLLADLLRHPDRLGRTPAAARNTVPLLLFCFLVGAGGVALIVFAIRR